MEGSRLQVKYYTNDEMKVTGKIDAVVSGAGGMTVIRSLIRYIKGYVKIRVEGCSPERFINMCSRNAIYIWGLEPVKSGYEMYLELAGFRKIRPLARKSHTKVVLVCREGLPFSLFRWRKRSCFSWESRRVCFF